jgi:hypothetical protein
MQGMQNIRSMTALSHFDEKVLSKTIRITLCEPFGSATGHHWKSRNVASRG